MRGSDRNYVDLLSILRKLVKNPIQKCKESSSVQFLVLMSSHI